MKNRYINRIISLLGLIMVSVPISVADKVPCIVLSGTSENDVIIELYKYNRIYFNKNSVTVSSTTDETLEDIELLYSLFNHIEFKDANPSVSSLESIEMGKSSLFYLAENKSLLIESDCEKEFIVGVFNPGGTLLLSSKILSNNAISVEHLSPGVYLAIASSNGVKLSIKFIVR